jgi:competence protein ComGF
MKKGYILAEFLIAMIAMCFMLVILSSISIALLQLPEITFVTQLDLFKLQIAQVLERSKNFKLEDQSLCFNLDYRYFCIENVDKRLIKKPGYEILLNNVRDIRWELNENEIILHGINYEESFTFKFLLE